MSLNECIFMGNLTRDVELKSLQGGTSVANFCIAVSRSFKRTNGEPAKETAFLECEAWDTGGATIAKHFKKGDKIIIVAEVKQENWEDKASGQNRSRLKFRVKKFHFVDGKKKEETEDFSTPSPDTLPTKPDEDIPF